MAFYGAEVAVPGSATSVYSLLSLTPDRQKACEVRIQYVDGGASQLCIGSSSAVTTAANRAAELSAGEVFQMGGDTNTRLDLTQIFLVGTVGAGNIALVGFVY